MVFFGISSRLAFYNAMIEQFDLPESFHDYS